MVAACLGYFSWRLFAPPVIGIANNGDFAKISGSLHLGPASTDTDDRFLYVTRDYKRGPEYAWDSRYISSEAIFARIAFRFAQIFQHRDRFDIRWMGVAHLGAILLALAWLMLALRPLGAATQIAAGLAACLILGDAAYLGYCNSFFTDAAALAGVLLTVAALVDLAVRGYSRWRLAGFLCGALVLITSKSQHAALALPLAVLICLADAASGWAGDGSGDSRRGLVVRPSLAFVLSRRPNLQSHFLQAHAEIPERSAGSGGFGTCLRSTTIRRHARLFSGSADQRHGLRGRSGAAGLARPNRAVLSFTAGARRGHPSIGASGSRAYHSAG